MFQEAGTLNLKGHVMASSSHSPLLGLGKPIFASGKHERWEPSSQGCFSPSRGKGVVKNRLSRLGMFSKRLTELKIFYSPLVFRFA